MGRRATTFRTLREALGELLIASSEVEETLQDGIWTIEGAQEDYDHYEVATSMLGTLINKFEAAYNQEAARFPEAGSASELSRHVRDLSRERNDLIHGMWTFDADEGVARRHRVRKEEGGLALNTKAVKPKEVRDLARRFRNAATKLWEILLRLGDLKASA